MQQSATQLERPAGAVVVTSIPPSEARALASRGDDRACQRTTAAFVPWFPQATTTGGGRP